jgi:hypothetical protein
MMVMAPLTGPQSIGVSNKYRVYWNFHKKCFSLQYYSRGTGWRVCQHTEYLMLQAVEFKVYEAGRQRVINEKSKNVHAYVIGNSYRGSEPDTPDTFGVTYNPYKHHEFVTIEDGRNVFDAAFAKLQTIDGKPRITAYYV